MALPETGEIKAVARQGGVDVLVMGNRVYEKDIGSKKLFRFSRKRFLFLNFIHDGITVEEACVKAGLDADESRAFLKSGEAAQYLEVKELREIVAREARDRDRWWAQGYFAEEGIRPMSKVQCEVWKERGKRITPCSESREPAMRVEIIIDPTSLARAKEHRRSVEAQVVRELSDAV